MFARRHLFSRALNAAIVGGASRALTKVGAAAGGAGIAAGAMAARSDAQPSGTLNRVLKSGTLRVAAIAGDPPWSTLSPAGNPEGYDIDIANQLAKDLKVKVQFAVTDLPGRVAVLQTDKADVTIADFTTTLQRSTAIAFTDPYMVEYGKFFVLDSRHDLQKVEDLNKPNIKIGVVRGAADVDLIAPLVPNAQIKLFNTETDKYLSVDTNQTDACSGPDIVHEAKKRDHPGKYRTFGTYSVEDIGFGLPAGDFDWWRVLNVWIRQFNISGANARLFKTWFKVGLPSLK